MKIGSIGMAAAIVAASGAAAGVAAVLLTGSLPARQLPQVLLAVGAGSAVFVVLFLCSMAVIRAFILHKIKPMYQVVLARGISTGELARHLQGGDMISQMESELTHYSERSRVEIARLKENEKYRREFLGDVSHEMKTPIFTLQGYILTLLDGAVDDPAINRRYLERSEKAVDRMIGIVTDLEEISKLESGSMELRYERFDVAELAREIAEDASLEAHPAGITVQVGGNPESPEPPVWVTADRKYIGQVITNLIINSIKYGREGGHTRVTFDDMFEGVMIEVTDDGIGIAPDDIPRVFERFYRADKSRSREMGGTGLGLSIVKHIIEAHGQQITLRSQPNIGSTFSFTLSK
jgi:two-component system phosphate regulon sensor histidine kinase PhoR